MDTGVYCPLKIDQNSTNQLIIVDWTFTRNNWHVGTNDWSMDLVFETQLPPTTTLDHRGLPCRPDTLTHWPNGSTYWPAVQPIDLPGDPLIIQLDSFTLQFDQSNHWFDQLTLQFDQSGSIQWPTMHRHAVQFTNPLVWPIQKTNSTHWTYFLILQLDPLTHPVWLIDPKKLDPLPFSLTNHSPVWPIEAYQFLSRCWPAGVGQTLTSKGPCWKVNQHSEMKTENKNFNEERRKTAKVLHQRTDNFIFIGLLE